VIDSVNGQENAAAITQSLLSHTAQIFGRILRRRTEIQIDFVLGGDLISTKMMVEHLKFFIVSM
jgi:hypothetical protein